MFWEKEYTPSVVGCELSDEELQQFLNENDIRLEIVDNSTHWCAFAQYYALNHNFDVIKATSFSYMVSLFMTGMGVSAGTEMYFKEKQIELDLVDRLNEIKSENLSEERKVRKMFNYIYWTYRNHISDYEYATERLSFKLTPSEMQKFQSIEGKTNKDKFKYLLSLYDKEASVKTFNVGESNKIIKEYIEKEKDEGKKAMMLFMNSKR